jgi:hypothetical protein
MTFRNIHYSLDKGFEQRLFYVTSSDILVWNSNADGSDCRYIARLGDTVFELNCDPAFGYIVIDGTKYFLGSRAQQVLCQLILQQQERQPNKKSDAKIEKINKMFDELLADEDIG